MKDGPINSNIIAVMKNNPLIKRELSLLFSRAKAKADVEIDKIMYASTSNKP